MIFFNKKMKIYLFNDEKDIGLPNIFMIFVG